jgi:ABC-2 type transport system permease protein
MALVPVWLLLAALVRPDFSGVTPTTLLLAVPAIVLGFALCFFQGAAVTCAAFWTTRAYAIGELYFAIVILFSGQFVPLELMPPLIQQSARFLPFQLMRYFPIQLILGKLSPDEIARNFLLAIVWVLVSAAIFFRVWRAGLRRFSAVGA